MHIFIAFRDLALSPANLRDSLTIFAENSMSTSRNNWNFINLELLKSSSRFPGKAHRLAPDPGAGLLLCSTRDLLNNSDCSFIASGQDRMWGACSVWGWRMEMEKNPLSSAKPGPPPGPGSFLWASPSLFDRHRTGCWRERRVWEQINCHLTEIPSSIVAAFPISKECVPVRTVQAVQGTVQTEGINGDPWWLSSVCPWSIDPDPDSERGN